MNKIKTTFSINDLENISGIKAHTIRIWEKRYNILTPNRASRDIRYYDIKSLQKILNISFLIQQEIKISKIAEMSETEMIAAIHAFNLQPTTNHFLNKMKLAMYSFDSRLFEKTYQEADLEKSFSAIFQEIFLPLLNFIGLYWQTKTITTAHEHFITNLIYQKIQLNIEKLKGNLKNKATKLFVLYLPQEEMHEIGLIYLNYELMQRGFRTIYLGRSIPLQDLAPIKTMESEICFVSTFTIYPSHKLLEDYFESVKLFLNRTKHSYWAVGQQLTELSAKVENAKIKVFGNIPELLTSI
jgi:MerR family transcriptional regulator, light-induced transcriptional regulator